jgi:MoaA/NifB/PqqE/SkfB family radical SAM enzyme
MSTHRLRQVIHSVPRYCRELAEISSGRELHSWTQHKLPYFFAVPDFPPRVEIELTNGCNFGCLYCHRSVMTRSVGFIETSLFSKLLREITERQPCALKICGLGEPSLHPDFARMMSEIPDNIPNYVYTNGNLFQRFDAATTLKWNIRTLVVSIDGLDAESFERQRVGGNYAQTERALADFFHARKKLGCGRPEIEIRHVILPTESYADLRTFRREWLKYADTVKFNYLIQSHPKPGSKQRPRCRDVRREMYVRWDGRVPLCGYQESRGHNGEWLGNAADYSIAELWKHPRLQQVRLCHEERDLSSIPFCNACGFR